MKQPLTAALTKKPGAAVAEPAVEPAKAVADGKMTTSIRIHPDKLFALKTLAHHRRARVNTLIDEAIDHYLEMHHQPHEAA
jgi:predicted HicB family RNase H-like nuclease